MTKLMETMFKAGGESYTALKKAYEEQHAVYARLRKFEDMAFGTPGPNDETKIMGASIRHYGARPNPEWQQDGTFLGFRFDWNPLNKPDRIRYAIPAKPVPAGWTAVPEHPGLYRPDPVMMEDLANECAALNMPYFHTLEDITGSSPIITIQLINGAYPRAYQSWPEIHVDHTNGKLDFYIDMPKDYKGQIFQPPGSTPLPEKEWYTFRNSYGDMYEGHGARPQGVRLPSDYVAHKKRLTGAEETRYFRLAGESLRIYREFEADQKKADETSSKLMKAWKAASHSYCGTELVSAEFKSPPGRGWKKSEDGRNSYEPDEATAEGRAIKAQFAALPQRPDLKELQKRLVPGSPDTQFPLVHKSEEHQMIMLEYSAKKGAIMPPPGAAQIPAMVYHWIRQDQMDALCGVQPPPPPPEIKFAIDQFLATIGQNRKSPQGPSPI
ncbi:MAG: hypothetical protein ACXW30_02685 [Micavibrio sp.]